MPLLGIDSEGEIDLYIFDTANVPSDFPWELSISVPGFTHGEKGGMGYSLSVSSYAVV